VGIVSAAAFPAAHATKTATAAISGNRFVVCIIVSPFEGDYDRQRFTPGKNRQYK